MGLFSETFNTLDDLLLHEIQDLYDAEHRIKDVLPNMIDKATNPQLKEIFQAHLQETQGQIARLETVFEKLGQSPKRETCEATKGLISEGEAVLKASGDSEVIDAALIAAAQRIKHYELAGYGAARQFAHRLGHVEIANLLQQTSNEVGAADEKLTAIAVQEVNPAAVS